MRIIDKIIKIIATIAVFVFFASACALDSESWIPYITASVSMGIILLYMVYERWLNRFE